MSRYTEVPVDGTVSKLDLKDTGAPVVSHGGHIRRDYALAIYGGISRIIRYDDVRIAAFNLYTKCLQATPGAVE